MSIIATIRVAIAALMINRGRSALTSLGIIIGIGAVIAMVSAGGGAREKLDESLESVGKNLILIRAGARTQQGQLADFRDLTLEDVDAIRREAGQLLVGVAPAQVTQRLVSTPTGNWLTSVIGSTPDIERVRNWTVEYGRFYGDDDVKKMAPVCLLGQTVRRKLFPNKPDPVGEWLRVDGLRLHIIGVVREKGRSPTGADPDDQVFVPITTMQRKLVGEERIGLIVSAARSEELIEEAKTQITRVVRERHHLRTGEPNDFDVSSVREMAELAETLTATMQTLVGIIASISLIVGGIGIMNIMLVSVTERTREIGIRMAIGATPGNVLLQFLAEALILGLLGGVTGVLVGIAGAIGLANAVGWPLVISPGMVLLAFAISAGVGIFFGYYPASKAARLDPIVALRYE
jgi:putative ABC transport system permease protein